MPWTIAAETQAAFEEVNGEDYALIFVKLSHAGEPDVRLVNDVVDYIRADNERWLACRFSLQMLTDGEDKVRGSLSVPNAVADLSEWILGLTSPLGVTIELVARSNFSDSVDSATDARTLVGQEAVLRSASNLYLRNISANAITIDGELTAIDLSSEPAYYVKSTKDRLPGLYR